MLLIGFEKGAHTLGSADRNRRLFDDNHIWLLGMLGN